MKTKPILFNTDMVQAILEGRKTQTRRIVKFNDPRPLKFTSVRSWNVTPEESPNPVRTEALFRDLYDSLIKVKSKYQKGDILWVKETFARTEEINIHNGPGFIYKAQNWTDWEGKNPAIKWKPSIFMPKEAARIFLKVTDVRVQRLQDITEEDAVSEGVEKITLRDNTPCYKSYGHTQGYGNAVDSFYSLWESIHGKGAWEENPWVWCYSFERINKPENF